MTSHRHETILSVLATSVLLTLASSAHGQFNTNHDCTFCHSLHNPAAGSNYLLNNAVVESLCQTCHGPAGISILKAEVHTNKTGSAYAPFTMTCMNCHNPHSNQANAEGGFNLKMIGNAELDASGFAKILTPNSGLKEVVFESRGPDFGQPTLHSFADTDEDGDGDLDGICESCHTLTPNHANNNFTPHHNSGASCVTCHAHDNFFQGEGDCLSCHDSTQGPRRPIVPEFSRTSHHVSTSITVADCEVCHDQSQHQSGNVRLKNVDTGATIAVLAADPFTNASEAQKLEAFCLACHDADGAAGTAPFSDAIMPPVIDAALWTGSSHYAGNGNGPITCFGDGQFGCHNTGHGSNKVTMLAPGDATASASTNDPFAEEEEFCFQCHNAVGPSGFDLETAFAQPINWVDQATGLNDNPNLNDRHDVQLEAQLVSGAKIECTDCHNPHVATSARPYILDPDPTDGRVPGTGAVFAGTDEWSEFCMDCHDGSLPAGVFDHTSPTIVDIRTTWADDGMGGRDSSGTVLMKEGTGWRAASDAGGGTNLILACWTCHSPHPVMDTSYGNTNHFSAVDTVYDFDGVTPLPGWFARISGSWQDTLDYDLSSNAGGADPVTDGGTFCNTCHDRTSMVTKDNCYSCHHHGDGGRW